MAVFGAQFGKSAAGVATAGVSATEYSGPRQGKRLHGFGATDVMLYVVRQMCK